MKVCERSPGSLCEQLVDHLVSKRGEGVLGNKVDECDIPRERDVRDPWHVVTPANADPGERLPARGADQSPHQGLRTPGVAPLDLRAAGLDEEGGGFEVRAMVGGL